MPTVGDTAQRDMQSMSATRNPHIGAVAQTRPTRQQLEELVRKGIGSKVDTRRKGGK